MLLRSPQFITLLESVGRFHQVGDQTLRIECLAIAQTVQTVLQGLGLALGQGLGQDLLAEIAPRLDGHLDHTESGLHDWSFLWMVNGRGSVAESFSLTTGILGAPLPAITHDLTGRGRWLSHLGSVQLEGKDGSHDWAPLWVVNGRGIDMLALPTECCPGSEV
jgi:hypothetical protein